MTMTKRLMEAYNHWEDLRLALGSVHASLQKLERPELKLGQTIKLCIQEAEEHEPSTPPPIEVEMRTPMPLDPDGWSWQCRLGTLWITRIGTEDARYHRSRGKGEEIGNAWLAALSKQLGVKLVAKWEDSSTSGPADDPPRLELGSDRVVI